MKVKLKPLTFLLLILGGSLMLSGCNQPLDKTSQVSLEFISPTLPPKTKPEAQETLSKSTKERQTMIKTLKDFEPIEGQEVKLTTTKGDIVIRLFRKQAPLTTTNFLHLVKSGFYDGVLFHRVIDDFMAQTGDPLTKDQTKQAAWGTGGPGYTIADELSPELKHNKAGIVSMANTNQPNTGGSQFFITFEATPWLDGKHAVFGEVISGMDVTKQLKVGDKIELAQIVK